MDLQLVRKKIHVIRGHRVILDADLAQLYNVETKVLKQAVKRNLPRFPQDFMFELTQGEYNSLRSQIVTLKKRRNTRGTHSKYSAYAFTEQGVSMLSSVLKSPKAIHVNITIMRAFVALRQHLLDYKDLKERIDQMEKEMNRKFKDIHEALLFLASPDAKPAEIGFKQKGRQSSSTM